jgi:hypothetical protein
MSCPPLPPIPPFPHQGGRRINRGWDRCSKIGGSSIAEREREFIRAGFLERYDGGPFLVFPCPIGGEEASEGDRAVDRFHPHQNSVPEREEEPSYAIGVSA